MMKKDKPRPGKLPKELVLASLVSLSCAALPIHRSAVAGTVTIPVTVRLVKAIEMTVSTSLNFGTMAMTGEQAGQARIDPGLNTLVIDGSSSLSSAGGTPIAGRFAVKGASYPISVSMADTSIKLTNGVATLTVNDFNLVSDNGGPYITITPAAGEPSITVPLGATLLTKPGQTTGTYVGSTRIFANFQ